jgi:spermidine/putrescine transport system ATP-binding protein
MSKELIRLVNCRVAFDDEVVLDDINLPIYDKGFLTLLGPSGCGKTTTLRIIGGFLQPSSGDVLFEGVRINDVPPHRRRVNTVFQKYALFPHLDVYENVAFGLRIAKLSEDEIDQRVTEMLGTVSLLGFEDRRVNSLSGGQQQRVAIARALVNRPQVLLLDEPLGALDLRLRKDMQNELKRIQQQTGITFIYVTHDQEEALTMSDTVVVMNQGVIQQIGTPVDIYNEPVNRFVADFIGESNIIEAVMPHDREVVFDGVSFPCVDEGFAPNEEVDLVIRPEDIRITTNPDEGQLQGTVTSVVFKGVHYEMLIETDHREFLVQRTVSFPEGSRVGMVVQPADIQVMKRRGAEMKARMRLLSLPYGAWLVVFVTLPLVLVLLYGITSGDIHDVSTWRFTLENFARFGEPIYIKVMVDSLWLAVVSTLVCLVLGYPVAMIIARTNLRYRNRLLILFVVPMWMNFLLRTYAWMSLLSPNGLINRFLEALSLPKLTIMPGQGAVLLGMVYNFLPFMVLPIYTSLSKLDVNLLQAAADLGANRFLTFWKVIFPLSIPGIVSGITMVFMPAVSTFVISSLLGGSKTVLIGDVIEQQFTYERNWHFGSSLSIILMAVILLSMAVMSRIDRNAGGSGGEAT